MQDDHFYSTQLCCLQTCQPTCRSRWQKIYRCPSCSYVCCTWPTRRGCGSPARRRSRTWLLSSIRNILDFHSCSSSKPNNEWRSALFETHTSLAICRMKWQKKKRIYGALVLGVLVASHASHHRHHRHHHDHIIIIHIIH